MDFIEPCFGIGHNLSLICQMTSEDIKHQLIIIIAASLNGVAARAGYNQTGKRNFRSVPCIDDGDDVGLHVLGCRVDILGTNCTKLLKVKMSGGGGGESRFGFSTCNHIRGAARRLLLDKKYILSLGVHFTADKKTTTTCSRL